ncbi:MAG: hypothetical protein HZA35_02580 [Parcubacteria group bacterium]|nr:hypothetical protein [Parcubacteria group bacterium]
MMKNQETCGEAEKIVCEALKEHQAQIDSGLCGVSLEKIICNRLRAGGLLVEKKENGGLVNYGHNRRPDELNFSQ